MANEIQPGTRVVRVPAPRGPANPDSSAAGMTPKEIIAILRRHVFLIIFLTILGTMFGGGSWFLLQRYKPKFSSMGTVEVLPPIGGKPNEFSNTQPNQQIFYEFRSTKAFRLRHEGFFQRLLLIDKIRKMDWYNGEETTADKVEYLKKNLGASAARDKSHIIISMTTSSAKESQKTVEEVISLFLSIEDDIAKADTRAKLAAAKEQRDIIQEKFDSAETTLKNARNAAMIPAPLGQVSFRSYLDERLADLENQTSILSTAVASNRQQAMILEKRKQSKDFDQVIRNSIERDPTAVNLRLKVDSLEVELKRIKSQFGNNHKRVREISNALEEQKVTLSNWKSKIGNLYREAALIQILEEQSVLQAQLADQIRRVQDARDDYTNLNRLRADYAKDVTKRDEFLAQLEEQNRYIKDLNAVLANPTLSKVKRGIAPSMPLQMSSPKLLVFGPGGFMLGFMLAVGLSFAVELLNDLLRSPSEVVKHIHVPLLGAICHKSEDRAVKKINVAQVVCEAPYSIISETYRQFKANLTLSRSWDDQKTLLITSGNPGDGKTSVSVNTAYTFAADAKRVLLIDTNFRKPSTKVLFARNDSDALELDNAGYGLSDFLMGQCGIDGIIRPSGHGGLDVVDSGPLPLNPSELLASNRMIKLINSVRQKYDYVIIDGPPMIVSEAKMLAAQVDGTILVFNAEETRRGAAKRALRELKDVNANVLGTVLIGVKSMKGGYFQEKYNTYKRYQSAKPALTS